MMRLLLSLLVLIVCYGCRIETDKEKLARERQQYMEKTVNEWSGKKMVLPRNLPIVTADSLPQLFEKTYNAPIKVVSFVDGTCGVCIGNLKHWQKFIDSLRQQHVNCDFIFYIEAENMRGFEKSIVLKSKMTFPWIFDQNDQFIKANNLFDPRFQTALLDAKDQVLLIGNFMLNPQLEDLYRRIIIQKSNE